jgi:hypothetical protein
MFSHTKCTCTHAKLRLVTRMLTLSLGQRTRVAGRWASITAPETNIPVAMLSCIRSVSISYLQTWKAYIGTMRMARSVLRSGSTKDVVSNQPCIIHQSTRKFEVVPIIRDTTVIDVTRMFTLTLRAAHFSQGDVTQDPAVPVSLLSTAQ